jgi:hypothetical protein
VWRKVISDYRYKFLIVREYTDSISVADKPARSLLRRLPEPKSETLIGVIMKNTLLAALLVAASATLAAPAFASGYGPAPFYRPAVGAPASQQGQNAQTVAAERANADANAYGGVNAPSSQSGNRQPVAASQAN